MLVFYSQNEICPLSLFVSHYFKQETKELLNSDIDPELASLVCTLQEEAYYAVGQDDDKHDWTHWYHYTFFWS